MGKGGHTFFDTPLISFLIPPSIVCLVISRHNSLSGKNSGREYGGTKVPETLIYENSGSIYQFSMLLKLVVMLSEILGGGWPKMAT
jgi:hypothetical protein